MNPNTVGSSTRSTRMSAVKPSVHFIQAVPPGRRSIPASLPNQAASPSGVVSAVVFGSALVLVPWYVLWARVAGDARSRDAERDRVLLVGDFDEVDTLRGQLAGARAQIRVRDRLRPTCVICLDATADRQTVRGPACTDCVGDLPDDSTGADPDRAETWAFPAAEEGR